MLVLAPAPEPAAARRLADELREARRYCRTDPDEAFRQARDAWRRLGTPDRAYCAFHRLTIRLMTNIAAACRVKRSCPDVLAGYLAGAAVELEMWADGEERDRRRLEDERVRVGLPRSQPEVAEGRA